MGYFIYLLFRKPRACLKCLAQKKCVLGHFVNLSSGQPAQSIFHKRKLANLNGLVDFDLFEEQSKVSHDFC
jgi:hypothetical protein